MSGPDGGRGQARARSDRGLLFTLAEATVGERIRIEDIYLGAIRSLCDDLGLSEGDRIEVVRRSDGGVAVRGRQDRIVRFWNYYAGFIAVGEEGAGSARARSVP